MNLLATIAVALRALRVNALRSALTMLGIIIGVAAVIAMVAVGAGAQERVNQQIESLGANLLIIFNSSSRQGGARQGAGSRLSLTLDDARALAAEIDAVEMTSPTVRGSTQLIYGNLNWSATTQGTTQEYFPLREWDVVEGRIFGPDDVRRATKVAVLGQTVVDNLFPDQAPVGEMIRIKKVPFEVIGVLAAKGQNSFGQDQDDVVLIPITTARKRVLGTSARARPDSVSIIMVKAVSADRMTEAEERVNALLRERHRIGPGEEDDFQVRNLSEITDARAASQRILTLLLAAVASIALLVGGIGIMNIMLVSVTERTREIGLRMAVGARRRDILVQFLVEAVTLCLIGGIVGVVVGLGGALLAAKLAGWPVLIEPLALVVAVLFSGAVGVFFGYYPARKAARLDPIDALRYE
ncbi:MAG: ABC transporter permease [Proteobacteria bacterium]|nr:ABC transporter permease [Pseudomonadota bacterium]MDA1059825.1 ABC transporter permease [Pseudomonadota bacterium]